MKVGVFDSGLGGITVLNKLIEKYPNNSYIYYGDTKNVPYGNKTIDELKELSDNIINFFIEKEVDVIVIACGTVSSNLKDYLINKYDIKIIDVISPTINYINESDYNKIGVLATNATINTHIFKNNINKEVIEVACPNFVPIIESDNYDELDKNIEEYLSNLDADCIILGCTHYPIIKDEISKHTNATLIDMSDYINLDSNDSEYNLDLYFTKLDSTITENVKRVLEHSLDSLNEI